MKCFRYIFIGCCAILSTVDAQRTFLDNLAFRPVFRSIREFLFGLTRNPSPDEAFQMNLKLGVSLTKDSAVTFWVLSERTSSFLLNLNTFRRFTSLILETSTSIHAKRVIFLRRERTGKTKRVGSNYRSRTSTWRYRYRWSPWRLTDSRKRWNGDEYFTDKRWKQGSEVNETSFNGVELKFFIPGVSYSIGGEKTWREFLTIPNILKEFNPNLYGYSVFDGLSTFKTTKFNVAELGAMSRDTPYMAKVLVQRMLSDTKVKRHHWKVKWLIDGRLCKLIIYAIIFS